MQPILPLIMVAASQATSPAPTAAATAPSAAAACTSAQHRQFDFWVGSWDVFGPQGRQVGKNLIEKLYNDCGIRENWSPLRGAGGGSLNIYVPEEKRWEQFWIDSQGSRALFIGGWNGKSIVIQGKWAGPLVRITYTPNPDGSVRQFGEQSTDDGRTWSTSFDLTYRRAAGS